MSLVGTRLKSIVYRQRWAQRWVHPLAVRLYLRRWVRKGPVSTGPGARILLINHCYDQDAEAIAVAARGRENLWILESSRVFKIVHKYVPEFLSARNGPLEDPEIAPYIAEYTRRFVVPLADFLVEATRLQVMVATSDIFFWLRPLIAELKRRGIAVVIQDKEGSIIPDPGLLEVFRDFRRRYPPIADRYCYWNRTQCDIAVESGVPADRAFVTGQPRSDFFAHPERWPSRASVGLPERGKVILFYSFESSAYVIGHPDFPPAPWAALRHEILVTLKEIMRVRPDTQLVVKAHPQQADLWEALKEFRDLRIPRARFATGAYTSGAFAAHADAIVGFQTTALIEGMMMGKAVIYAGWSPLHDRLSKDLLPIHLSGGCDVAAGPADLRRRVEAYLDGAPVSPEQREARPAFVQRFFSNSDGQASRRLLDAVGELASGAAVR